MAPPGAQSVGICPSGVGPREEKEYDVEPTSASLLGGSMLYWSAIIAGEM